MVEIPLQGTPGVLDPRNPTLLPNTDQGVALGDNTTLMSPADFISANPRADGSVVATLGGSVTSGDTVTLTITHPLLSGGSLSHAVTAGGSDNLDTLAEALAKAFNDDAQCQALGIEVDAVGPALTFNWVGPVSQLAVLSYTLSGGATETVTLAPTSGKFTSGAGPIIPTNNFQYSFNGSVTNFRYGEPQFVDYPMLSALINDGMPIV